MTQVSWSLHIDLFHIFSCFQREIYQEMKLAQYCIHPLHRQVIVEKIICSYIIVDQSVHMILLNHLGIDVRSTAYLMNVIEQKHKRVSSDWKGPWGFLFSFSNTFQYLVLTPNDTIKTYQDPAFSWSQAGWGGVRWGRVGGMGWGGVRWGGVGWGWVR